MDFQDTPEEAAYRQQVRDWLAANAPAYEVRTQERRGGDQMEKAKGWQAKKAEDGYACITWPKEWGGGGGTPIHSVIYGQEEAKYSVNSGPFTIGLGMCVPTVMTFADDATKQRFVGRRSGRGDLVPAVQRAGRRLGRGGGADRAVRDGDDWVINGQKVWTSGAHYSDFGIVLVRTNPDVPKHKGLTMFWIDMRSPGIEVKPIHQMSGGSDFNEVYFTDVRVKDSQRLGAVDDGWKVALVTLMNERLAVGGASGTGYREILELARGIPTESGSALADSGFRQRLADWYVQAEGLKLTRFRTQTALSRGETPGPESSIGKIISANVMQDLASAALDLEDQYGILSDAEVAPMQAAFQQSFMFAPGLRIAGGPTRS
jgi:alkylation response protein AidB-like acyl-CoA dehydrogenase